MPAERAQARREPRPRQLELIAAFQHTPGFFSSPTLLKYAYAGIKPKLPAGRSPAEVRGRRFFIDAPLEGDFKTGLCANCHSGPLLNETNEFLPFPPFGRGRRFQTVGVSEINFAGNPVIDFAFRNPDGTTTLISSPDPGRALITGNANDFESLNAFKIPSLWGAARTGRTIRPTDTLGGALHPGRQKDAQRTVSDVTRPRRTRKANPP